MKSIKLLFIAMLFYCIPTNSQVSVSFQSLQYTNNGQPTIAPVNCGNIDLGTSTSTSIDFVISLSKPHSQVVGISDLYVYTQKSSSDSRYLRSNFAPILESFWSQGSNDTYSTSSVFSINSSEFNVSGGTLYIVFKSSGGIEYQSCSYTITKTPIPTFTLSPTSLSLGCGDTNARTFTVTPANIPSGATVTYQWFNSGWSLIGSTANSRTLQPTSGTSLPSNIVVTPYINGVAKPSLSCLVTRAPFSTLATINGNNSICSPTENYNIANLAPGLTLTWSSSNTAIATLSNTTGNTVTVNKVGVGSFNLIATISNSCGQSVNLTKSITAYSVTSLPIPSGYLDVDEVIDCYNDAPVAITFYPDVQFGGTITLSSSLLPHPLRSQTKNITVKYINPCTGAYTSKVMVLNYQAPDCSDARISNTTPIYNIYPNPSNDIVNIDLKEQNNPSTKRTIIVGELFDMMGQSKSKVQITDNKATFSVRGLNKGIYVLKIYINDKVENHQIVVE